MFGIIYFVNHVAVRMVLLDFTVSLHLDEVLEDGSATSTALHGEHDRVVCLAIDLAFFLVVLVVLLENGWTDCAREVLEMVAAVNQSCLSVYRLLSALMWGPLSAQLHFAQMRSSRLK